MRAFWETGSRVTIDRGSAGFALGLALFVAVSLHLCFPSPYLTVKVVDWREKETDEDEKLSQRHSAELIPTPDS